jgi:putative membrane protein
VTPSPEDQGNWQRVHPISPLVRGWVAVIGVLVVFGRNTFEDLLRSASSRGRNAVEGPPAWLILAIVGGAAIIFGIAFFLSWYFTRYSVTDDHVRVNSGVLFRQQRQARIDRVQAIDVVQPLLARIFGLAELKFEVADAGKSAMRLSFLRLDEARRLRAAILARAAGLAPAAGDTGAVPEAPEHEVMRLSPARILGSTVLSGTTLTLIGAAAILAVLASSVRSWAVLAGFLPLLLGLVAAYWKSFSTEFNFRVAVSPDGVRLHYGLLDTRSQTIPPGRVQAVGITQGPLERLAGWYRVHVNVAGYGVDRSEGGGRSVLLPAGTLDQVLQVLELILPDPGTPDPVAVFTAGLTGKDSDGGFQPSPRRAQWLDPLAWRRNGYRATGTALLCRHGVVFRSLQVVPHERTQSLGLFQGPLMRRLRLIDFVLHSTAGPVRPVVHHLDLAQGRQLFLAQASRASAARRIARPDRWLEAPQPVNQDKEYLHEQ